MAADGRGRGDAHERTASGAAAPAAAAPRDAPPVGTGETALLHGGAGRRGARSPWWPVGVDEVGRGPLAGPVVAAAVVLDPARIPEGLCDSKRLSPGRRETLAVAVREAAAAWCIAAADVAEIDSLNILQASLLAMTRAVTGLVRVHGPAHHVQVDGRHLPTLPRCVRRAEAIVGGDDAEAAISAASILAKVWRDALMADADTRFPAYGFDRHKGYATADHLEALATRGPCPLHRRSFAPVAALLAGGTALAPTDAERAGPSTPDAGADAATPSCGELTS